MSDSRAKAGLSLGPILILIAAYFLWQMGDVAAAGANPRDAGPRFWPLTLAICLLAAGAIATILAVAARLRQAKQPADAEHEQDAKGPPSREAEAGAPRPTSLRAWLSDWGVQNLVLLLIALPAYVWIITQLGYAVSTLLLSTILMARLGEPSVAAALERRSRNAKRPASAWKSWLLTIALASLISLLLVALIVLLFDRVFDRPLPQGELLNLPF